MKTLMPNIKRVKIWEIRVLREDECDPHVYKVYALNEFDARLLAFALDEGFPIAMTKMTEEMVNKALEATKKL